MTVFATSDHSAGIGPAVRATVGASPAGVQTAQGGQSFAVALADQVARTAPAGSPPPAPAPGSRLARPDRDGNLYAAPRLLPGRHDEGPNGSTQVATHGAAEYSVGDLVDIINPLQQLPIIGTVYRALTGDSIKPEMRVAGGALYGGPIGMALAVADSAVEEASGRDTGGNIVAMFAPERAPITRGSSSLFGARSPETSPESSPEAPPPSAVAAATALQPTVAAAPQALVPDTKQPDAKQPGAKHPGGAQPMLAFANAGQIRPGAIAAPTGGLPLMPATAALPRAANAFTAQNALGPPPPGAATPEMSGDAFNALMKSIGANSADAAGAALASTQLARADSVAVPLARADAGAVPLARADAVAAPLAQADAAATPPPAQKAANGPGEAAPRNDGTIIINGAKFFPANRKSIPAPAPVPLNLPPRNGYNQAFVQMQHGLDKYAAMKGQPISTSDESEAARARAGAVLDSRF